MMSRNAERGSRAQKVHGRLGAERVLSVNARLRHLLFFERYSCVVKESSHRVLLLHWPLLVPTAVWVLLFSGLLASEVLRAVLAIACIALMLDQWQVYRRSASGERFAFLSLLVVGFILASLWLGLNVVRFYTYDGDAPGRICGLVVRVQERLVWIMAGLLIVVAAWVVVYFAVWLSRTFRVLVRRSNP